MANLEATVFQKLVSKYPSLVEFWAYMASNLVILND